MNYDELQIEYEKLNIQELDLSEVSGLKGLCFGDNIAIEKNLTSCEKTCILAEEIGHYCTTTGNILDQTDISNRKQERIARLWAYDKLIGLSGIVKGYKARCRNRHELAEYLEVSEDFLKEALECYHKKYGSYVNFGGYTIMFDPALIVIEKFCRCTGYPKELIELRLK